MGHEFFRERLNAKDFVPLNRLWRFGWRRSSLSLRFSTSDRCLASPSIQLRTKCKNTAKLLVKVPMDWKTFPFFPELHGTHDSAKIVGDVLPGIQAVCWQPQPAGLLRLQLRQCKILNHAIEIRPSGEPDHNFRSPISTVPMKKDDSL
jgi:hypothetical protein